MDLTSINPNEKGDDGFVLSASALVTGSPSECPELCSTPQKAAEMSPGKVMLRGRAGELPKGAVDWYHTRIQGAFTLPHALLGVFKACLSSEERIKLNLNEKLGLNKSDVELLKGQGLLVQKSSKDPVRIPTDAKRVIRASIQVRVDPKTEEVTLALRQPYAAMPPTE